MKTKIKQGEEIRCNGYIATPRRARKEHKCSGCGYPIGPKQEYYEIVKGGGGLGWLKFPERCHFDCASEFLDARRS